MCTVLGCDSCSRAGAIVELFSCLSFLSWTEDVDGGIMLGWASCFVHEGYTRSVSEMRIRMLILVTLCV